jgi:hypothetical protein
LWDGQYVEQYVERTSSFHEMTGNFIEGYLVDPLSVLKCCNDLEAGHSVLPDVHTGQSPYGSKIMFHNFLLYWPALIIKLGNACHHTFRASYLSLKISSKPVCNMPDNTTWKTKKTCLHNKHLLPFIFV